LSIDVQITGQPIGGVIQASQYSVHGEGNSVFASDNERTQGKVIVSSNGKRATLESVVGPARRSFARPARHGSPWFTTPAKPSQIPLDQALFSASRTELGVSYQGEVMTRHTAKIAVPSDSLPALRSIAKDMSVPQLLTGDVAMYVDGRGRLRGLEVEGSFDATLRLPEDMSAMAQERLRNDSDPEVRELANNSEAVQMAADELRAALSANPPTITYSVSVSNSYRNLGQQVEVQIPDVNDAIEAPDAFTAAMEAVGLGVGKGPEIGQS
jgi:hypothetical protein